MQQLCSVWSVYMPTKIPTYPREFCSWTLLQPHSYVLSLFLCKSLVDTISADQCQPRCCWSPKQKPFPEGRGASGSPLSSDVRRCSQCQHLALHRKGCTDSIGLLSYSVHCSQPFCVRINQLIPVSLGGKKKKAWTEYLWEDYLNFQLSHLPWTYTCTSDHPRWKGVNNPSRKQQCWILNIINCSIKCFFKGFLTGRLTGWFGSRLSNILRGQKSD